ncbi:GNAT family N-acetyltransferase [Betaproteobacteria bacterium GR16-43]|nr:GNAT family N-acetyltransferase [Betaproteobacteria bacterium GR16-43]
MKIVRPLAEHLPSFIAALEQGWSPDTTRGPEAAKEALEVVLRDPAKFLERAVDREAAGDPVRLPDGSKVPRIPGYNHWMWDGEFCGTIGFRWVPGTPELPPYVLGHIGYGVVPWKRRKGYATEALRQLLPIVRKEGLPYVEITCDPSNEASIKVIEMNGGILVGRFAKPEQFGGTPGLRYRIAFPELKSHA